MIYYTIPGNNKLKISKDGRILPILEKDSEVYKNWYTIDNTTVTLEMYGSKRTVKLDWLAIICRLGLVLPKGYEEFIFNYSFKKANRLNRNVKEDYISDRLPFEVVFTKPVYYHKKFRIIPEYPSYAVSADMEFINITTGKKISPRTIEENRYPSISLINNFYGKTKTVMCHMIVAITWLENDDYVLRPLVNHKDGNKNNFRANNLEYASYSENLKHAYETGLRTDNHSIRMYDKVKKEIKIFSSVTDAFKSFGAKPRANLESLFKERNGYYIAKNRYEIRYLTDKRDFVLLNNSVAKAQSEHKVVTNRLYQAINTKTKEEVVGKNSIIQRALNISESAVTAIARKKTFYNDWIIRDYTTDVLNLDEYKEVQNKKASVVMVNIKTGERTEYSSLREAGREVKLDPITIKRLIASRDIVRNMKFEYKQDE